jgi:cytochrome c oxidase subunit 2
MRRPSLDVMIAGAAVLGLIVITVAVLLSQAGKTLYPPPAATSQGKEIRDLYDIVFGFAVVIFLLVEGLIVWSVIRYRRKPTDVDLPPQTHGHNLLEVLWTVIPTVIVLIMFVFSFNTLNSVDALSKTPGVRIKAVAAQFQWAFDYFDQNGQKLFTLTAATTATGGGMAVPVGQDVEMTLESKDVIHAFYVPRFLFKRDVVPGHVNVFNFKVNESEAGRVFHGQCAELCGTGHRLMLLDVIALSQTDYDAWVEQKIAEAQATPAPPPSGEPAVKLDLVAKNATFDKHELEATADQPFSITLDNQDIPALEHDVDIHDANGQVIADEPHTIGGQKQTYVYNALPAGTYTFICSVHPFAAMTGTLTVK